MRLEQRQELTLEQAIEQIADLDQQVVGLNHLVLNKKFKIGGIVSKLSVPYGSMSEALLAIKSETGVHENQLRMWRKIYLHYAGNENEFNRAINSMGKAAEYKILELINVDTDPEILGSKELATRTVRRIERIASDLETINSLIEKEIMTREDVIPLMQRLSLSIDEFKYNLDELENPKPHTPRSREYMNLVKSLPCCVTGSPGPNDPHHVEQGGVAMKGSDFSCIPLRHDIHELTEKHGHSWLEETYNVRIGNLIAETMHQIFFKTKLNIPSAFYA